MSEPMPLTRMGMPERRMLPVVTVGPYVLLALLTVTGNGITPNVARA